MTFRKLILASVASLAMGGAHAAITFASVENAGSTLGSTDTFLGATLPAIAFPPLATVNGSGTFFLEALDPGLSWGDFALTIWNLSDTNRSSTATATFAGLTGTLSSFTDLDPGNSNLLQGWSYTFAFTGQAAANTTHGFTVGGFGGDRGALAELNVTAVPEPETYAMMLAGLGAVSLLSRRRRKSV